MFGVCITSEYGKSMRGFWNVDEGRSCESCFNFFKNVFKSPQEKTVFEQSILETIISLGLCYLRIRKSLCITVLKCVPRALSVIFLRVCSQ